jgi:uncharacterized protein involved in exopolysaccharide biosynthesis
VESSGKASASEHARETDLPLSEFDAQELLEIKEQQQLFGALRLIWRRRRWLAKVSAIGGAIAIVVAVLLPVRYQATTRLMPPDSQNLSSTALLALSKAAPESMSPIIGDLFGAKSTGSLFMGVLQSRTVRDRLINRFDLRKEYWVSKYEDARKKLAANTSIAEDRRSGIIEITVTDRSPQRAAAMAQAYVEELDRLTAELNTSAAHRERVFVEGRLQVVQQELGAAQKALSEFASKNAALDIKEQGRTMVEAAARLQGELIAAQSELKGLEQIYSDNNVRVRAARARAGELQRQLDKLGGMGVGKGKTTEDGETLYPSIRELPLLGVTYADLYRRTKVLEAVYEFLTKQYELAKVEEAKEIPSVKVLDPAVPPERKAWPPRIAIVIGSMFLSLALGIVWVLARAGWGAMDPHHPLKDFAHEIVDEVKVRLPSRWKSRDSR